VAADPTSAIDLDRIVALREFEPFARERMTPSAFDYVAGGAWDEWSLAENEAAWRRYRLRPRVLVDVGDVATGTTLLGAPAAMPVAIAPMAVHGLAHPEAECATARAAAAAGIPVTVSTMSSASLEDIATAAPDATRWFQLYLQADPGRSRELVERAAAAGYAAVILTVDLPRLGYRERDRRWGFDLPELGNFREQTPDQRPGTDGLDRLEQPGPTPTWEDVDRVRSWSDLPLVLKGIQTADDARIAIQHDIAGIVVSNHGARQLDRVAAAVDLLPEVVDAVGGRTELLVDGGVRRGLDVVTALALGAQGVLIGRPMLWALATAGQAGVERALRILHDETEIAMALLGAVRPDAVTAEHIVRPTAAPGQG
jgi:4-hydroxymandelate oxidase